MIPKKIMICGIPHKVRMMDDTFNSDGTHFGEIEYAKAEIRINKALPEESMKQTLIHEFIHGALIHLNYLDESANEKLVQGLAVAISLAFDFKEEKDEG